MMKHIQSLSALAFVFTLFSASSAFAFEEPTKEQKQAEYLQAKTFDAKKSRRHVSTSSDADIARQQRLLQYTRNLSSGRDRVKSAKTNFRSQNNRFSNGSVPSDNKRSTKRTFQRPSIRTTDRNFRRAASEANTKPQRSFRNSSRRSSFEFTPEPGQIWGR